jgi:hypothetical protein
MKHRKTDLTIQHGYGRSIRSLATLKDHSDHLYLLGR